MDILDKVPAEHKYNIDIWYLEQDGTFVFKINGVNERYSPLVIDDDGIPYNYECSGDLTDIGMALTEELAAEFDAREEAKQRASEIAFMKMDAERSG